MKRPAIHYWTLIYFILGTLPILFMGLWAVKDGWFPSELVLKKHPDPADHFYSFNQSLAFIAGLLALLATIPIWILLLGKQNPWVWTTSLVFIALGLSNNPVGGIPILIFWIKDNNKTYYGKQIIPTPIKEPL